MLDILIEELNKASDRIKSGIRGKKRDSSDKLLETISSTLLNQRIPKALRDKLTGIKQHLESEKEKAKALSPSNSNIKTPEDIAAAREVKTKQISDQQKQVQDRIKVNPPTREKQLGHAAQYEKDVNYPKLRSKQAERTSPGVKERVYTGEGIALRNKTDIRHSELQSRLNNIQNKINSNQLKETIRIPAIPEQHKSDDHIVNLMALRSNLSHPEDLAQVDKHINNRIGELSSTNSNKKI